MADDKGRGVLVATLIKGKECIINARKVSNRMLVLGNHR